VLKPWAMIFIILLFFYSHILCFHILLRSISSLHQTCCGQNNIIIFHTMHAYALFAVSLSQYYKHWKLWFNTLDHLLKLQISKLYVHFCPLCAKSNTQVNNSCVNFIGFKSKYSHMFLFIHWQSSAPKWS